MPTSTPNDIASRITSLRICGNGFFCTIGVLAGVDFFTLRRWGGHIDAEALKIYAHIAAEQAQLTMQELTARHEAKRARAAGKRPPRKAELPTTSGLMPGPHPPGGGRASATSQQSHGGQQ